MYVVSAADTLLKPVAKYLDTALTNVGPYYRTEHLTATRLLDRILRRRTQYKLKLNERLTRYLALVVNQQQNALWPNDKSDDATLFIAMCKPYCDSILPPDAGTRRFIESAVATAIDDIISFLEKNASYVLPDAPWRPRLYFDYEGTLSHITCGWHDETLFAGGAIHFPIRRLSGSDYLFAEPDHTEIAAAMLTLLPETGKPVDDMLFVYGLIGITQLLQLHPGNQALNNQQNLLNLQSWLLTSLKLV